MIYTLLFKFDVVYFLSSQSLMIQYTLTSSYSNDVLISFQLHPVALVKYPLVMSYTPILVAYACSIILTSMIKYTLSPSYSNDVLISIPIQLPQYVSLRYVIHPHFSCVCMQYNIDLHATKKIASNGLPITEPTPWPPRHEEIAYIKWVANNRANALTSTPTKKLHTSMGCREPSTPECEYTYNILCREY